MGNPFFVIDGIDGSGKNTTAILLEEKIRRTRQSVFKISFPQYGHKSAGPVELYLQETVAPVRAFDSYAASLFYAVDRAFTRFKIEEKLKTSLVIADRYVSSNAGHQGSKISDIAEREKFLRWLYTLEYDILHVPRPTKTILLLLPPDIAIKRKHAQRKGKEENLDGHEQDGKHIRQSAEVYRWLAETYPDDFIVVETVQNNKELTPHEVLDKVYEIVQPYMEGRL